MDPGETVEQTIVREVKEETGLDVAVVRKIGEYIEKGSKGRRGIRVLPNMFRGENRRRRNKKARKRNPRNPAVQPKRTAQIHWRLNMTK